MPNPKLKKQNAPAKLRTVAPTTQNLPGPERVPKERVGEVVQDFVNFGGATAVEAQQQPDNLWLVTATG